MTNSRVAAGTLAHKFLSQGDATGWFEALYAGANWSEAGVPWAHLTVNPSFAEWLEQNKLTGAGRSALVIGCGLGDDAEELARLGFRVTAFDISETAIEWCRQRFPDSAVNYEVADLFDLPQAWQAKFDFVLEAHTIQALPPEIQPQAIEATAGSVAPGGTLLVMCWGGSPPDNYQGPPWPVTKAKLDNFQTHGLTEILFEEFLDHNSIRRFRIEYRG